MDNKMKFLRKILSFNRWFIIPAIFVLYASSAILIVVGIEKFYLIFIELIKSISKPDNIDYLLISARFIGIIDIYILATVFYSFALVIYKLFIDDSLTIRWLKVETMKDIKSHMAKMSVLFLCTLMIQKITEWKNAEEMVYFSIPVAITSSILIWYFRNLDILKEE